MVRNYQRKTQRQSWTIEQRNNALAAIRSGAKIREAARNFGIPESTLRHHLKPGSEVERLGRKPLFTKPQEKELANHVMKLANLFYGVTPRELRRIAFDFAEANHLPHKFNKESGLAGKDWLSCFIKRNPELRLRQPEGTSLNRISSFNSEAVGIFFKNLEKLLTKFKFQSNRIFNVDESGITTVQKKSGKVYAKRGQKQIGVAISAERGQTITILCAVSAAGTYVPPMIIYPRKRMSPQLEKDGPIGCIYSCSDNGWSNDDLFLKWIKHFQNYVKATEADPILLILDNHASHISLQIYNFCRENHIVLLTIPPHTSNHLQPLDLTFFGPLKKALFAVYDSHMISTAHERITVYDVARLFNQAYMKVATIEKGVSGFKAAGIFPFNPEKFTEEDFAAAEEFRELVLDPEERERSFNPAPPHTSSISVDALKAKPSTSADAQEPPTPTSLTVEESTPSTSKANLPSHSGVKISDLVPIPKKVVKAVTKRKTSTKQQSEIWTSTPMKATLLEKEAKRNQKNEKQNKNLKRKVSAGVKVQKRLKKKVKSDKEDTSDDNSDSSFKEDLSDDNNSDYNEFAIHEKPPVANEICVICGEFGKNRELWFRCVKCAVWVHSECSGWESAAGYTCDDCRLRLGADKKKEESKRRLF